jgi:hypothetical protein
MGQDLAKLAAVAIFLVSVSVGLSIVMLAWMGFFDLARFVLGF